MSKLITWEIFESARINLEENLPKVVPMVKKLPVYLIGIEQLNDGLRKTRRENEERKIKRQGG